MDKKVEEKFQIELKKYFDKNNAQNGIIIVRKRKRKVKA
jgi:hypothetical protein